jgi:hypothetical protein
MEALHFVPIIVGVVIITLTLLLTSNRMQLKFPINRTYAEPAGKHEFGSTDFGS